MQRVALYLNEDSEPCVTGLCFHRDRSWLGEVLIQTFFKKNFIKQSGTFHYIVENLTSLCQKCLELGDFAESRELSHGL